MQKKFFFMKLNPPRPTFAQDMNGEERAVMMAHVAYWTEQMKKKVVRVFGPVMDPKGSFGVGVVEVNNREEVEALIANDPATKMNTYEWYEMRAIVPENLPA